MIVPQIGTRGGGVSPSIGEMVWQAGHPWAWLLPFEVAASPYLMAALHEVNDNDNLYYKKYKARKSIKIKFKHATVKIL